MGDAVFLLSEPFAAAAFSDSGLAFSWRIFTFVRRNQVDSGMKNTLTAYLKKALPYVGSVLFFLLVSYIYFAPDIWEGRALAQHDTTQGRAMGQEIAAYQAETGEKSYWTNSMFSGMPAFQISPSYKNNAVLRAVSGVYRLGAAEPASFVFIMMTGFFILLLTLGVRWYLAAIGAVAYAFSSYFFIIITAGHIWKFITLAYIPPTIAGMILIYRKRYLWGCVLAALFGALQLYNNHIQMSYYFMFVMAAWVIAFGVQHYREHTMKTFAKSTAVLLLAGAIAVGCNLPNLYHTYKFSKETMRGGHSELTSPETGAQKSDGLDREYITQWSYGKMETLSLLIPNIKGGGSGVLGENETARKAASSQIRPYLSQVNSYWGDQPGTVGPVYVGALVFLLFVLGCFIVKTPMKWALLIVTVLTVMLSWGKNFMPLTDLFIDYFPMYNRFRAVSSILVVAEFCIPLLAVLALKEILERPQLLKTERTAVYVSVGLTLGVSLLAALFPSMFGPFNSEYELAYMAQEPGVAPIFSGVAEARKAVLSADAWRSVAVLAGGIAVLWLFYAGKLNRGLTVALVGAIILVDMYGVDKRYLNSSHFVPAAKAEMPFPKTENDKLILQDTDPNYRVFNMAANSFNEAGTSYYHKSVGGYNAAKLRRYQDLIDRQLLKGNMEVFNMLNTRYFILPSEDRRSSFVERNDEAFGNAWWVSALEWAATPDEEMAALDLIDLRETAVADERFRSVLSAPAALPSDNDTIYETVYKPNELRYRAVSRNGGLAVFSEIYFPWGWKVSIDGEPVEMGRVNYVLRALNIPAGDHEIVFRFEPASIPVTESIAYVSMALILLAAIAAAYFSLRTRKKGSDDTATA